MSIRKIHVYSGAVGLLMTASITMIPAQAAVVAFTDSTAFGTAIAGFQSTTLNFDSQVANTTIADGGTVEGVTFQHAISDGAGGFYDLIIADSGLTTSGSNYLGVADSASYQFIDGDEFTMDFGKTVHAIGLFVIGAQGSILENHITITADTGSSASNGTAESSLADSSDAFFIGLIDTDGFQKTTLSSLFDTGGGPDAGYFFAIDDITYSVVPLP